MLRQLLARVGPINVHCGSVKKETPVSQMEVEKEVSVREGGAKATDCLVMRVARVSAGRARRRTGGTTLPIWWAQQRFP